MSSIGRMNQTATSDEASPAGRQEVDRQDILQILAKHGDDRGGLIAVMEQVQSMYGHLPQDALRLVSLETGRSLVDIYGIATFYRAFTLVPRGKHLVCACQGTACHVRGAPRIVDELERHMGIRAGQTTPDGLFTLETVNCLGACALGPVVVIDGRYFSKVRASGIRRLLDKALAGFDQAGDGQEGAFPVEASCPRCNHSLMDTDTLVDGLPSIRMTITGEGAAAVCNYSALLDGGGVVCEGDLPDREVGEWFCPRCHGSLSGDWTCERCGAPMARLAVKGGGMIHLCRRGGCRERRLDLECVNG